MRALEFRSRSPQTVSLVGVRRSASLAAAPTLRLREPVPKEDPNASPVHHKRYPRPMPTRRNGQQRDAYGCNETTENRRHRRCVVISNDGEPEHHCIVGNEHATNYQQQERKYELRPVHVYRRERITSNELCVRTRNSCGVKKSRRTPSEWNFDGWEGIVSGRENKAPDELVPRSGSIGAAARWRFHRGSRRSGQRGVLEDAVRTKLRGSRDARSAAAALSII